MENLDQFNECNFKSVTAGQNDIDFIRNSFISGLRSGPIRLLQNALFLKSSQNKNQFPCTNNNNTIQQKTFLNH